MEDIAKQENAEGLMWLFLTASSKMQKDRSGLKMEFVITKEEEYKDLENSQPGLVFLKVC
jgi:hypothetical protein